MLENELYRQYIVIAGAVGIVVLLKYLALRTSYHKINASFAHPDDFVSEIEKHFLHSHTPYTLLTLNLRRLQLQQTQQSSNQHQLGADDFKFSQHPSLKESGLKAKDSIRSIAILVAYFRKRGQLGIIEGHLLTLVQKYGCMKHNLQPVHRRYLQYIEQVLDQKE